MKNRKHELEHEEVTRTSVAKPVLTGLVLGGLVGAATMLLYAPRSGQETRAEIQNKAMELRDRTTDTVKDTVSQVKSKAQHLKDNVQGKAVEMKHRGQQILGKGLDRVSETAQTSKQVIQES